MEAGNEAKVPRELPVLIFSGEHDPVGKVMAEPKALAARYRANGLTDVTVTGYPGARHETLNETNRDEVTRDVIAWLDARLAHASTKMSGASGVPAETA